MSNEKTVWTLDELTKRVVNEIALGKTQLDKFNLQYELKSEGNQYWGIITSEKYEEKEKLIQDMALIFKRILGESWQFLRLQQELSYYPPQRHFLHKRWRKPALKYVSATLDRFTDANSTSSATNEYVNMLRALKFSIECDLRQDKTWKKRVKLFKKQAKKDCKNSK